MTEPRKLTDEQVAALTTVGLCWGPEVAALAREVQQARERIAALDQAIRAAEWVRDAHSGLMLCPWCDAEQGARGPHGHHAEDCIVRTLPPQEA